MAAGKADPEDELRFRVAPHIVEDLGLNLYTSLPRVLAEFVANAYDADATRTDVRLDFATVAAERAKLRELHRHEKKNPKLGEPLRELETRILPDACTIVVEDDGHGMSRSDLANKFLVIGRRRRRAEPEANGRSPGARPLMGRKGLGKLAGFGVARRVEVCSRRVGEKHATRIMLSYDEIVAHADTKEVPVVTERLEDGGGFAKSGTRITLSSLMHGPMKTEDPTLRRALSEHFELISAEEFQICCNDVPITPQEKNHAWAWPEPEGPVADFVAKELDREDGGKSSFSYRMRFMPPGESLPASRRGVRVYVHSRLAAAPSLLGADTNMHGFRQTDYLDGVVNADFLDEEETDYIATDRQSLRWETPLLAGLHQFLNGEIRTACAKYQAVRDAAADKAVTTDAYTADLIAKQATLSKKDKRLVLQIASHLSRGFKLGVESPAYKENLAEIVRAFGHGKVVAAITQLAEKEFPELKLVAPQILRLAADELDAYVASARARVSAITALQKIVKHQDFKKKKEENQIQKLLERAPWMIDPTFGPPLTANQELHTAFVKLAEHLKIGGDAGTVADDERRPDLVFLLGNLHAHELVIVELKAANVPLKMQHMAQLLSYVHKAKKWLEQKGLGTMRIRGELIGTRNPHSTAEGVEALNEHIVTLGPNSPYRIRDFVEVLSSTEAAHRELIEAHASSEAAPDGSSDGAAE